MKPLNIHKVKVIKCHIKPKVTNKPYFCVLQFFLFIADHLFIVVLLTLKYSSSVLMVYDLKTLSI